MGLPPPIGRCFDLELYNSMHFQPIHGADADYFQAMVRFPGLPSQDSWWGSYSRRMSAAPALLELSSAYRLHLRANGDIDRLFSAVVTADRCESARNFFAGLSFLEGLGEGSVQLPAAQTEFESWTSDFPRLHSRVTPVPSRVGADTWLSTDFRIADHLEALLLEAHSQGVPFAYQAHFRPFLPDRELLRRVGRNLITLETTAGVPAAIVADQKRQADRLRSATILTEEIVGTDTPAGAKWLIAAIRRLFQAQSPSESLESPDVVPTEGALGDDISLMMHSSVLYGDWSDDDMYCASAAEENFRTRVVAHRPSVDTLGRGRPPGSADGTTSSGTRGPLPPLSELGLDSLHEGRGHIFVSYSHRDFERIAPILRLLVRGGLPIWYDRGIYGGSEWDEVLEQKIRDAAVVLTFMSQAAVNSKYCRREIKFADAINRPLLVVALEPTQLAHGLDFMLRAVQQIKLTDREFDLILNRSIRKLMGTPAKSA
jgi:TIR domain